MNTPLPTDGSLSIPPEVTEFCHAQGLGDILTTEELKGGRVNVTRRLVTAAGSALILKQSAMAPEALYQRERNGLEALGAVGQLRTPAVYAVGDAFILLEDIGTAPPRSSYWDGLVDTSSSQQISARLRYWENFGHALARQHQHTSPHFGFPHDNYQGIFLQHNPWMADGHDFFIQYRIMQFLELPLCAQTLTVEDRLALERFGERLRQIIPVQPAVLLHGDLWIENTLVGTRGEPAVIDPAVYYGWPEVDLGVARSPEVPEHFSAAYNEIHPLLDGWQERLELVRIKNYLSLIAHFGDQYGTVEQLRALVAKYV